LNDGAPNVGSSWSKDAFSQSELVLAALKTSCTILRKGGTFVTKIFRSADYNALIWCMNKFFEKVEATKPEASRTQSAEIFVVGLRFIAPDLIDPKMFDVKYVFKEE
jgi:AdoMet-dependent rRNA methyltransferase SPB1